MKNLLKLFVILFAISFFSSCSSDDDKDESTPPQIIELTAGMHDSGSTKIERGGEFSVDFEAEVMNDGRLDYYHIEIHDHPASGALEDEYKLIDSTFRNDDTFTNLKNAHTHQHIAVPEDANLGLYHVVVTVVDSYGNSTDTEEINTEIEIIEKL